MSGDDIYTLYEIDIQTPASPHEVATFVELFEANGYTVITDLEYGVMEVRGRAEGYDE